MFHKINPQFTELDVKIVGIYTLFLPAADAFLCSFLPLLSQPAVSPFPQTVLVRAACKSPRYYIPVFKLPSVCNIGCVQSQLGV